MSSLQLNSGSSSSIISLSSFDTIASLHGKQWISYNNNKIVFDEKQPVSTKSFDQTIDRAVEYFEQILAQCVTSSNTSLIQQERKDDIKSKFQPKKRDGEDFLRLRNKKQREPKINCRKWCEEQNRRIAKYNDSLNDKDSNYRSNNRNIYGFTFYCRKALLQKPNGITYICIRKRFD